MLSKKVVVKLDNGKILKGWTSNFSPTKESFYLHIEEKSSEKSILEIKLSSIRAVFFVKKHGGNKNYKKVRTFKGQSDITPSQRKIIVTCKDGEKLYGTTLGYNPNKKGFFIFPIDSKDNNERIFVIQESVENVELKDFNGNN
ncbi:MAG: hypothetical protein KAH35_07615 [Candidatus Atribacteria bacterium]|nr:hypothetical protein [Candidatus Atribacteria bacterium]